jgi:hypothetical protein
MVTTVMTKLLSAMIAIIQPMTASPENLSGDKQRPETGQRKTALGR